MNPPGWMSTVSVGTVAVSIFVVLTVGGLVWALLRPIVRSARSTDKTLQELRRDWFGTEGRPGFPAVPGVPQRLLEVEQVLAELRPIVERIEREMKPNGGSSLRDQIQGMRSKLESGDNRREQDARELAAMRAELSTVTRALENARTLRALAAHAEQPEPQDGDRRAG